MRYSCLNCKLPPKSKFGGIIPVIIINGVIIAIVLLWFVFIIMKNHKTEPVHSEEDVTFKTAQDKLIMTKSNKKYLLKINSKRMKARPSTIFTIHQNKYNALELNAS